MKVKEIGEIIKAAGLAIGAIAGVLLLIGLVMYGMRWFSQEVTPINTAKMDNNVTCYQIITGDGAAISCIQVNNKRIPK